MIERIIRAIRLDWTVFGEIARDRAALKEAAIIVGLVTFLSAIGTGVKASSLGTFVGDWMAGILVGWIGWAIITYVVGRALFKGKTDLAAMMRVLGYANAPYFLGLLAIVPCIGWLFPVLGWLLALAAGILAIREAMDLDTIDAIVTVFIGWIIVVLIKGAFLIF